MAGIVRLSMKSFGGGFRSLVIASSGGIGQALVNRLRQDGCREIFTSESFGGGCRVQISFAAASREEIVAAWQTAIGHGERPATAV